SDEGEVGHRGPAECGFAGGGPPRPRKKRGQHGGAQMGRAPARITESATRISWLVSATENSGPLTTSFMALAKATHDGKRLCGSRSRARSSTRRSAKWM